MAVPVPAELSLSAAGQAPGRAHLDRLSAGQARERGPTPLTNHLATTTASSWPSVRQMECLPSPADGVRDHQGIKSTLEVDHATVIQKYLKVKEPTTRVGRPAE